MKTLKWYDYVVCVIIADVITAGFLSGSFFLSITGFLAYDLYETWRKA